MTQLTLKQVEALKQQWEDEALRRIRAGETYISIALAMGCTEGTIFKLARKRGLRRRADAQSTGVSNG